MRKEDYINRHQHLGLGQRDLERKWRRMKEEQEMQLMLEAMRGSSSAPPAAAGGGGGGDEPPPSLPGLVLTFDDIANANALVGDASSVEDWNAFFDLPALSSSGNPFTSVQVSGNNIRLIGGSNITTKEFLFLDQITYNPYTHLLAIDDAAGCVVAVGEGSFTICTALATVSMPAVTEILCPSGSWGSFGVCESLNEVNFPALTSLADGYAFVNCSALTEISLPEVTNIGAQTFAYSGVESVDFPKLTTIQTADGYGCFQECGNLTSVDFPELLEMGTGTFRNCSSLATANLPKVETIGNECFWYCSALSELYIPLCTSLGEDCENNNVFIGIEGNTMTVTIGLGLCNCEGNYYEPFDNDLGELLDQSDVTLNIIGLGDPLVLEFNDIANANALVGDASSVADWNSYFNLPNLGTPFVKAEVAGNEVSLYNTGEITLYSDLFANVDSLLSVNDQGGCVVSLQNYCFSNCPLLTSVVLPNALSAGESCFAGGYLGVALTDIELPALTTAGVSCFANNTVITSISLPALETAGASCFEGLTLLTSISLPALETAGTYCFNAAALTSIELPSLITAGDQCFYQCSSLDTIISPTLTDAGVECFFDCTALSTLNLPSLYSIGNNCFQNCGALTNISLPSLNITGTESFLNCTGLLSVTAYTLQTIGPDSFSGCTNLVIVEALAVVTAGPYCFQYCTSLVTINLPNATTIGEYCFANCSALASITLPACTALGPTTGDDGVFSGNTGNTINLTIPAALMTCNGGNPDGDIQYLTDPAQGNTVNITQIP